MRYISFSAFDIISLAVIIHINSNSVATDTDDFKQAIPLSQINYVFLHSYQAHFIQKFFLGGMTKARIIRYVDDVLLQIINRMMTTVFNASISSNLK